MLRLFFLFCFSCCLIAEDIVLENASPEGSVVDRRLVSLMNRQEVLLERVSTTADEAGNVDPDVEQQIQALGQDWQRFVTEYPEDIEGRILYGKFLRTFRQYEAAVEQFLAADKIDAAIPVVKQQIGNYMAENGLYAEALPWFIQAVALAPEEPRYHYQTGELLYQYRWQYIEDAMFTREALDQDMQTAFAEASRLSPKDFSLKLRYGESFYDVLNADWAAALEVFEQCLELAPSEHNRQALYIHLARVNAELGNKSVAKDWIRRVHLPALEKAKSTVSQLIEP